MSARKRSSSPGPGSLANLQPAPPAPIGNKRAEKHGAHGTVLVEPGSEAAQVLDVIAGAVPLRGADGELAPQDRLAAEGLAVVLVRLRRAGVELDTRGEFTKAGKLKPVADYERRLLNVALGYMDALGLTPRGRVKLGLDLARASEFDLAQHWAKDDNGAA